MNPQASLRRHAFHRSRRRRGLGRQVVAGVQQPVADARLLFLLRTYQWQQRSTPPFPPPPPPLPCGPSSHDEPDMYSDNTNSFTTTGGHSAASNMDDSSADLLREAVAENHLWNQVLADDGHGVFDYLKKMDGDWELNMNPNSFLSWFIAPPVPCHDRRRQLMVGSEQNLASTSSCQFHEANLPLMSVSDGVPFDRCSNTKQSPAALRSTVSSSEKGSESSTVRSGEGKKKKKRSEETAETLNESKCGQKMQVPKAKIAEKINALQQLVSPFGKTDQASVLMETITYIRILQEQVQLLSEPYLKSSAIKGQDNSRGRQLKMKVESEMPELRNKGLCLVPVSSIPRLKSDSNAPEFWLPAFHSFSY